MALYHMINVLARNVTAQSLARYSRHAAREQLDHVVKQWNPAKRHAVLLSSSLIVLQNKQSDRYRLPDGCDHSEFSPEDSHDAQFTKLTSRARMQLFEDLRASLPSDALARIEEAKERLSSSFSELQERLNSEPLSHIITEQATRIGELASAESELVAGQVADSLTETLEETRETIQNIASRLVKSPEPGRVHEIASPTPNNHHVDIRLTDQIISANRRRGQDEDTELVPRIKAAVRQFKAEIEADDSGDPPISLVSRKAKERIERFIHDKRNQVAVKLSEKLPSLELVKEIVVVGKGEKEKGVLDYITSNVPDCDTNDPELVDIVSDSAGTFYNDKFHIDDIEVEDEDRLVEQGWSKELTNEKLTIWKKLLQEENISLYKIFGRFDSISAVEFYNAQVNDQYRTLWDKSVSSLFVVDNITNNREIVYWATKFPFPLQDRDYVFERSHFMDDSSKRIEISSRSITHKSKAETFKFVRVFNYGSSLVIRAEEDLYQRGMSYCLTYYDDFGMPIPAQVKDRLANTKIPEFLEKVREAAEYLGTTGKLYVPYPEPKVKKRT